MNEMEELDFINSLEKKLSESLQPVSPDPRFIHSLREKLSHGTSVIVEKPAVQPILLILGLGLFTGALMLWLFRRPKA
jgi:hypothetical protein